MRNSSTSISKNNYAGFGRRFLAYWVDFLILLPISLTVQFLMGVNPLAQFQAESLEQLQQMQQAGAGGLSSIIALLLGVLFYLIMWVHFDGATPGKKLMGIKIVKTGGGKISYPVAFIRYISYFLSAFVFLLGYIWIVFDKKKQGWHDKIAGTVVVKTNQKPKTFLAIILSLLAIIIMTLYLGAAMFQGYLLGMEAASTNQIDSRPALSLRENRDNMSAEAKVHYDKTQELFSQMREVANDPAAIQPIADQNIAEAKLAVEAEPDNSFLWSNLGNAYGWPNTVATAEDSLEAYRKAEELDPNNVIYINQVGDQLISMGQYEEAILQFQKTLRLTDSSGFAHLSIGKAYKELQIYDEAQKHFTQAINVFESNNSDGQFDDEILQAQLELSNLPI